jgi:hypothetical protein
MVFYLTPIVLALLAIATRKTLYYPNYHYDPTALPSEWTMLHRPMLGVGIALPYPIIGLACNGPANTDCLLGLSPK